MEDKDRNLGIRAIAQQEAKAPHSLREQVATSETRASNK